MAIKALIAIFLALEGVLAKTLQVNANTALNSLSLAA